MGCSHDQVDIRGRWKTRRSGRVVDAYISPEQPYIDAHVASALCQNAPIAYKCHPQATGVTNAWLLQHVVPAINQFFGPTDNIALVLALPLLWAALDPSMEERMDPEQREYIQEEYAKVSTLPEGVNPVVKVCLSVWHHQTELHITEVLPMNTGGHQQSSSTSGPAPPHVAAIANNPNVANGEQVQDQYVRAQAYNAMSQGQINQEFFGRFVTLHNQTQQQVSQEGRTNDKLHSNLRTYLDM